MYFDIELNARATGYLTFGVARKGHVVSRHHYYKYTTSIIYMHIRVYKKKDNTNRSF